MERNSRRRTDYATEQKRRLEAGVLFAQGLRPAEVARRLGVSRQAASRWYSAWMTGGETALRGAGQTGRKRKLSKNDLQRLEQVLLAGPKASGYTTEIWTLARIAAVVWKQFRVRYHRGHVWKLLGELGWSCQRPEARARERDEERIRRWLKHRWPAIKKRRATAVRS